MINKGNAPTPFSKFGSNYVSSLSGYMPLPTLMAEFWCYSNFLRPNHVLHLPLILRGSTSRFVGPSVHPSVCPSVCRSVHHTLLLQRLRGTWPYCTCPNAPLTSIMAPAHPHATGVAVYPALFFTKGL